MPEIGEVARAVHYIRRNLVGRTLSKVTAVEDGNVFGKVGTSHTEIMKHLTGKKVVDAGQQGKYFWMIMSSPPHPVMHFGMAGWFQFKSEHTFYYRKKANEDEQWPPKYWRLMLETDGKGEDKVEAAYVDLRRFGRVRLVDCPGKDIRQHSPLVENGPDPVQDKEKVTVDWLRELCQRKKVPIKAMLLDQANISGIGNWVGDEIMYDAKMHPEQYANTLSDAQIKQLHKSLHYICGTAVELLADSEQFPETWLFKHRWGKGKKDASKTLPNGEKIVFLTVGGRTSAVIPSVQKKTGPVTKEISEAEEEEEKPAKSKKSKEPSNNSKKIKASTDDDSSATRARGTKRVKTEDEAEETKPKPKKSKPVIAVKEESSPPKSNSARKAKASTNGAKKEEEEIEQKVEAAPKASQKRGRATVENSAKKNEKSSSTKRTGQTTGSSKVKQEPPAEANEDHPEEGRRRSGRLRK